MSAGRVRKMGFPSVYSLLLQKIQKNGRTKEELDRVICWLTGYDAEGLEHQFALAVSYERFFDETPAFNASGLICFTIGRISFVWCISTSAPRYAYRGLR